MKSLKSGKSWAFLTSVTLHSHLQVMCSAEKESSRKLMLQYMWQHILTCKLCVVLRKSPLKTYAAVHVTSNSHLQAVCSAEKESFKKLMLAVHSAVIIREILLRGFLGTYCFDTFFTLSLIHI